MEVFEKKGNILIQGAHIDIDKTFNCGQCFRFDWDGDTLKGMAYDRPLYMQNTPEGVLLLNSTMADYEGLWKAYLDMDRDYIGANAAIAAYKGMEAAAERGYGIQILNQDPWETLCSFIISQNNNIPRIKKIINSLCLMLGKKVPGSNFYSFPTPKALVEAGVEKINESRCGFRAKYLYDAAKKVLNGDVDLESLKDCSFEEAVTALQTIKGVGVKVANCVALFGLGHRSAFPIDVWIKRVIERDFGESFDPTVFGENAGLAQQYMYYSGRF